MSLERPRALPNLKRPPILPFGKPFPDNPETYPESLEDAVMTLVSLTQDPFPRLSLLLVLISLLFGFKGRDYS